MNAGPKYPKDITEEQAGWLEESRTPDPGPRTKCCAGCQAGPIPRQFPCGRKLDCACHAKRQE